MPLANSLKVRRAELSVGRNAIPSRRIGNPSYTDARTTFEHHAFTFKVLSVLLSLIRGGRRAALRAPDRIECHLQWQMTQVLVSEQGRSY
jgi:hypothetical protein